MMHEQLIAELDSHLEQHRGILGIVKFEPNCTQSRRLLEAGLAYQNAYNKAAAALRAAHDKIEFNVKKHLEAHDAWQSAQSELSTVRTERDNLQAECDRLRGGIEVMRNALKYYSEECDAGCFADWGERAKIALDAIESAMKEVGR